MSTATTFQRVPKVKQACDSCHARKVKCDGTCPCSQCTVAELRCTYLAVQKKKGPQKKGPQGHLKQIEQQRIPPAVPMAEAKFIKAVKDELGPDINTLEGLLRDYEQKRTDATLMVAVSKLLAKRPDLRQEFLIFLKFQVELSSSNNLNTISTSHPVANGTSTSTLTAQGTSIDDAVPQQLKDAQQYEQLIGTLTTRRLCSTSPPSPQWLALSIQPPPLTRPGVELFPPPVAQVLKTNIDVGNIHAVVTLYTDGIDVSTQLQGQYRYRLSSNGTFSLSRLRIRGQGVYTLRVTLVYDCHIVEHVDSNEIYSGPRPTEDIITARDTRRFKRQLLYQDEITYKDDYIGVFPNRKIYEGSVIHLGLQTYRKLIVLIPGSELIVGDNNAGFCNARDGLSVHDGNWYDDGEIEWTDGQDATIRFGEDGEMYRRRMDGIFQAFFVALERRVTVIDAVTYITHTVLY